MSNKLDFAAIEQYSKQYASRLCDEFYSRHDAINGNQVLNLSTVGQVNVLVVNQLYEKWKADTLAFRSSYFDFEQDEVKQALQTFMNVVSQYIAVKREHFEPMLRFAVASSLVLLFDPKHYFESQLKEQPNLTVSLEDLKRWSKYTRFNKFVISALQEKMGNESYIYVSQATRWLDDICTDDAPYDEADKFLTLFSQKVPVSKDDFIKKVAPPVSKSFFDLDPEDPEHVDVPVYKPAPPAVPQAEITKPVFVEEKIVVENAVLNDKFTTDQQTINDVLTKDSAGTLADKLSNGRIDSIVGAISLNQKFGFINQLFHGDAVAYTQAIHELEHCRTFDEAQGILQSQYANKYMWRQSPEEADDLLDIVRRRFT